MAIDLSNYGSDTKISEFNAVVEALGGSLEFSVIRSDRINFKTVASQPIRKWGQSLAFQGGFTIHRGLMVPANVVIGDLQCDNGAFTYSDRREKSLEHLNAHVAAGVKAVIGEFCNLRNSQLLAHCYQLSLAEIAEKMAYLESVVRRDGFDGLSDLWSTIRDIETIDGQLIEGSARGESIDAYVLVKDRKLVRRTSPADGMHAGWFAQSVYLFFGTASNQRARFGDLSIDLVRVSICDGEIRPLKGFAGDLPEVLAYDDAAVVMLPDR